ncbi:MAG: RNA-binding S4 domain-containing protein [Bacillota bacterium]|uniref:RQC P-site tRNA stabilizing factor n=1 Tax=Thermanaerosceptrum fracticalcis TaxID=1712410 RepID=A0A7G6E5M2_THEFR|nr:RNA-binding S4 domain-containing protein [Thermanaerosceptrum fracticalcis]QNB47376.1 RNA-binding S4 domain-containing protein [Thermanaerosceptrum fracticalcis]
MRLDKFLKVSRLIKRRTLAKEVSDAGRVTINGRVAKPSSEVKVGDILEIGFGAKMLRAEILELKETVKAEEAKNLYRIVE